MSAYLSLIGRSRGWALINFFCLWDGRLFEVGANSRLGAYSNKYGKNLWITEEKYKFSGTLFNSLARLN